MIKRIGVLFLLAIVFSGAWWDKPAPKKVSAPAPAVAQPAVVKAAEASAPLVVPPVAKQEAMPNADAANASPNNALKMLTEGDPAARKAKLESLVRLSEALRKQREMKERRP